MKPIPQELEESIDGGTSHRVASLLVGGLYTGPYFDPFTTADISVQVGTNAILPCRVRQAGNRSVSPPLLPPAKANERDGLSPDFHRSGRSSFPMRSGSLRLLTLCDGNGVTSSMVIRISLHNYYLSRINLASRWKYFPLIR